MPKFWSRFIAIVFVVGYLLTAAHFIALVASGHLAVRWDWALISVVCGLGVVVVLAQQLIKESDAYYAKRHPSKDVGTTTNSEQLTATQAEGRLSDSVKVDKYAGEDATEQVRHEPSPVPEHILKRRRTFKQKWSDLVGIAELILANPGTAIEAKEIWMVLHPEEVCTPDVRSIVSNCVSAIRDMLLAEQNGWEIPKGRYVVQPVSENDVPDIAFLSLFIQHLRNADKTT